MKELLKELGIESVGHYGKDGIYTVDLKDSDEFGVIYSKLDLSDDFNEFEDSSQVTLHNSSIIFESDTYQIILLSDFDQDSYKLTIKEI